MKSTFKVDKKLVRVSDVVMNNVLGVKSGESMLIITNPEDDPLEISKSLFNAATKHEVEPVMIVQKRRSTANTVDPKVLAALSTMPDIYISVSSLSLGQDLGFNILDQKYGRPYEFEDMERERIFGIARAKRRGFWSPYITKGIWKRTIDVDYQEMKDLGEKIAKRLTNANEVQITTEKGTYFTFSFEGMICYPSTGPYGERGKGGNLPTGESFGTPKPGTSNGEIVFDGAFGGLTGGDIILENPVYVSVEDGKVVNIRGEKEAEVLRKELDLFTKKCYKMAKEANFDADQYASNVRNIGEAGYGVNPSAELKKDSSLLEWEKVLRTVHVAIGRDYGVDPQKGPPLSPTLNHIDGLIKNPSVTVDGELLMKEGWYIL